MYRVLLVDDDKMVRKGLIATMPWREYDFEIIGEANNGENALEFLKQYKVDILITDLSMPNMSGIELMEIVSEKYPEIWIVVLTFHQDFEWIQTSLRLGAIDYIAKVQLEYEQSDAVLKRIRNRILLEQSKRGIAEERVKPLHDAWTGEQWEAVQRQWCSLLWVVQEDAYRHNMEQIMNARPPAHKLESLFNIAKHEWIHIIGEDVFTGLPSFESLRNWSDWKDWIAGARVILKQIFHKAAYSEEISYSILQAIEYIHVDLKREVRIEELAKRVNMSRSYFSQCFKDIVGLSAVDYLKKVRMLAAQKLLIQSTNSIRWIAQQCGYWDEKYFSRVFQEFTGITPSKYRKKHAMVDNTPEKS